MLAPAAPAGGGRRPQVDFAVTNTDGSYAVIVESKWTGRSTITTEQLIWDLIRLELIAFHSSAECYFVLGGFKKKIQPLLTPTHFALNPVKPITKKQKTNISLHLDQLAGPVSTSLSQRMKKYSKVKFPSIITCDFPHHYPHQGNNMTFQVYTWRVRPNKRAGRAIA